MSSYFISGSLNFEVYCSLCEEMATCVQEEYVYLRKLAFCLYDLNGDDQICDLDVIEFDKVYI